MRKPSVLKRRALGAAMVVVLVLIVTGVVLGYENVLTPSVDVTVNAERAGLLMNPEAAVNMRGLKVGEVRRVRARSNGAALEIAIDPGEVPFIPANVTASIATPTLFGAKYVQLDLPQQPAVARIAEGAQIPTTAVVTEANTLLEHLNTLLTSVDAAELNTALGAVSTGLQGRGERIGRLVIQVNTYLRKLNPSLPALNQDLATAADVTNTYARATPDLVRTLDNLASTSDTLVDEEPALEHFLSDVTSVADDGSKLLKDNGDELQDLLRTLRPTTGLLDRYSPMFPCLFAATNQLRNDLEHVMGYAYPGIHTYTSFLPSQQGYLYPRDLAKVGVSIPPTCFGGPISPSPKDLPFPHVIFDDGWLGFAPSDAVTLPGLPGPTAPAPSRAATPGNQTMIPAPLGVPDALPLPRPAQEHRGEPSMPSRILGGLGGSARDGAPR